MENHIPALAKKLWNVVRVLYFMLRKGKRKLLVDLNVMVKRGKIAGKALRELVFSHHSHHSDAASSASDSAAGIFNYPEPPPSEYEFSCSNTPAHHNFLLSHVIPGLHLISKKGKARYKAQYESIEEEMEAINNALETMSLNDAAGASPVLPGLGFGQSPMVRQLRVTDSPFPISSGGDGDSHVDEAAEEFIKRFYSQLRRQPLIDG